MGKDYRNSPYYIHCQLRGSNHTGGKAFATLKEVAEEINTMKKNDDITIEILHQRRGNIVQIVKGNMIKPIKDFLDQDYPGWKIGIILPKFSD